MRGRQLGELVMRCWEDFGHWWGRRAFLELHLQSITCQGLSRCQLCPGKAKGQGNGWLEAYRCSRLQCFRDRALNDVLDLENYGNTCFGQQLSKQTMSWRHLSCCPSLRSTLLCFLPSSVWIRLSRCPKSLAQGNFHPAGIINLSAFPVFAVNRQFLCCCFAVVVFLIYCHLTVPRHLGRGW